MEKRKMHSYCGLSFLKKAWQKTLHKGLAENYKVKGVAKAENCFGSACR